MTRFWLFLIPMLGVLTFPSAAQAQRRGGFQGSGDEIASAPVPADLHEVVRGPIQALTSPADRMEAIKTLEAAQYNAVSHRAGMPPFHFQGSFQSTGALSYTGTGETSEIWASGRNWQVSQSIGDYSMIRRGYAGVTVDEKPVNIIPMRAQMVRSEFMWPAGINNAAALEMRKSAAQSDGEPVTCLLFAGGASSQHPRRRADWKRWSTASETNRICCGFTPSRPAPLRCSGTSRHIQFHGRAMADHITIYVNGSVAADASFTISDVTPADEALLAVRRKSPRQANPLSTCPRAELIRMDADGPAGKTIEPVLLHVQLGPDRKVLESEVCAAANPRLAQNAQEWVKNIDLSGIAAGHVYLNVRFVPR